MIEESASLAVTAAFGVVVAVSFVVGAKLDRAPVMFTSASLQSSRSVVLPRFPDQLPM
jgi:hypothetical protein